MFVSELASICGASAQTAAAAAMTIRSKMLMVKKLCSAAKRDLQGPVTNDAV